MVRCSRSFYAVNRLIIKPQQKKFKSCFVFVQVSPLLRSHDSRHTLDKLISQRRQSWRTDRGVCLSWFGVRTVLFFIAVAVFSYQLLTIEIVAKNIEMYLSRPKTIETQDIICSPFLLNYRKEIITISCTRAYTNVQYIPCGKPYTRPFTATLNSAVSSEMKDGTNSSKKTLSDKLVWSVTVIMCFFAFFHSC